MIFETMIDNLRDIMDSKKKALQFEDQTEMFFRAVIKAITDYIIRTLVKTDEEKYSQKSVQLVSSLSGFLELVILVDNDEKILDWLEDENNWKDCFLVYSDPSLLDADIFWSIVKALCVIEDGIKDRLSFTSESMTSSLHHILICFASLFERQNIDPANIIMLLHNTTISACYGKGNGKKPLKGWEQKEMLSKFFADKPF
jgi:hypothetical protein